MKDFDPATGKLVNVPAKEPVMANPVALAPTGSHPGTLVPADGLRSILTGVGVYGGLQILVQVLSFFGTNASLLGSHGPEIAAVSVALAHLISAYMADNTPRLP